MPVGRAARRSIAFLRRKLSDNRQFGRVFMLFGVLSLLAGGGLFALTETLGMGSDAFWTYRTAGWGLAGLGFPALLFGLALRRGPNDPVVDIGGVGVLLCALGVVVFLLAYPWRWNLVESPGYVMGVVSAYGLGAMLCSSAVGLAVQSPSGEETTEGGREAADRVDDETGFIWGNRPDS